MLLRLVSRMSLIISLPSTASVQGREPYSSRFVIGKRKERNGKKKKKKEEEEKKLTMVCI